MPQQTFLCKFLGFNYTIEYKPGKDNLATDALSREMEEEENKESLINEGPIMSLSTPKVDLLSKIKRDNAENSFLLKMRSRINNNEVLSRYNITNDCVMFKNRFIMCPKSDPINKILIEFHASVSGSHLGVARTIKRVSKHFWWPRMNDIITKFVRKCTICQKVKGTI